MVLVLSSYIASLDFEMTRNFGLRLSCPQGRCILHLNSTEAGVMSPGAHTGNRPGNRHHGSGDLLAYTEAWQPEGCSTSGAFIQGMRV